MTRHSPKGLPLTADRERVPFEETLFQAVLDGAAGDFRAKESMEDHLRNRFGFRTTPFTRKRPVKDCFLPPSQAEERSHLLRVVDQRMSAALFAPAGCGKTTMLLALRDRLPESRFRCTNPKVTDLSKRDFCRDLFHALSLQRAGNNPMLVRRLQAGLVIARCLGGRQEEKTHFSTCCRS